MPFVRVVTVRARPGKVDELIATARADVEHEAPPPGLLHLHALRDVQDPDAGLLVSFFQTRAALEANTANLQADFAALQPLLAAPPAIAVYEVVFERPATTG